MTKIFFKTLDISKTYLRCKKEGDNFKQTIEEFATQLKILCQDLDLDQAEKKKQIKKTGEGGEEGEEGEGEEGEEAEGEKGENKETGEEGGEEEGRIDEMPMLSNEELREYSISELKRTIFQCEKQLQGWLSTRRRQAK